MENRKDDIFTFYFIGVVILFMAALIAGSILGGKPANTVNLLVPAVFGSVGLFFLVGTYAWSKE
jgi:hypothetical protein